MTGPSPTPTPHGGGEGQPFGYTGYRYDRTSGTYFAQAREYRPETGRFHAQDVVAGNGAAPVTLNRYTYCLGNPVGLVDLDGGEAIPWWVPTYIVPIGMDPTNSIYNCINNYINNSDSVIIKVIRGDIQFQISDAEWELMKQHPIQAATFVRDAYRATELADEKFGFTPDDGTLGNAYRHAMWNALLTQSFKSKETAKMWTDAHEDYPEEILLGEEWMGHTRKEHTEMDLHNNAIGRDVIGPNEFDLSIEEIDKRIMERIKNGEMMVLVDDPRCNLEEE